MSVLYIYKKYKSVRNALRNATRKLQKDEQKKVAMQCKKNLKIFWKYINSKRQIHDHIGNLKSLDKDGNMLTACTDSEKAEALYFVFFIFYCIFIFLLF